MDILFLSQYYPNELLPTFMKNTKVGLDFAAHNLNMALFQGFKENNHSLDILNTPHIGSFPPFYKRIYIPSFEDNSNRIKSISYFNISYLKRLDIRRRIKKEILEWCKLKQGKGVIIFYNFELLPLLPIIKSKYPNVKTCLLVTDLKEYMAPDKSFYNRLNGTISSIFKEDQKCYDYLDSYILLAQGMKDRLPIGKRPWLLMEGIYNPEVSVPLVKKSPYKTILYTGNVGKRYGILTLMDAFSKIKSDEYRLWIRGNGETVEEIKRQASKDSRIVYFDQMSKKDLIELQAKATVLVNPVSPKEDFTNYFFPSKTLEYLASKTPTMMFPLACLPNEYNGHILYFKHDDPQGMANDLIEICEKSQEELQNIGIEASKFINDQKTPLPQVKRILNFLESI